MRHHSRSLPGLILVSLSLRSPGFGTDIIRHPQTFHLPQRNEITGDFLGTSQAINVGLCAIELTCDCFLS